MRVHGQRNGNHEPRNVKCEAAKRFRETAGKGHVLITGGAGFIGTNLADRLATSGQKVFILDNLSRRGSEINLAWLTSKHGSLIQFEKGDVRNPSAVRRVVRNASVVFHFAAQVAVTSSLESPRFDFEVNAGGTLQLLEAIRGLPDPPVLLFTSTNKVYGTLADIDLDSNHLRYVPANDALIASGVSERRNLDFHSPYGCSKGAADQYILDYARTFGLPAVVFRMSCIYGPHQNGTEDQGWVAHFLIRAMDGAPIQIYGDGKQVRDVLFVDDLVNAFEFAVQHIERTAGQPFNIGGGAEHSISLLELLHLMRDMRLEPTRVHFHDWRHADQRYYVSDTRKFRSLTGWTPCVRVTQGLELLRNWLAQRSDLDALATTHGRDVRTFAGSATATRD